MNYCNKMGGLRDMKIGKGRFFITVFVMLCLCLSTASIVSAVPSVDSIETDPESPKPLSTLKVIAAITGDNIESVTVTISECDSSQCYPDGVHINLPMTLNADGKYETEVTLTSTVQSVNHVQYAFIVNDGEDHILTNDDFKTELDVETDNGGGGDNGSPGFELVFVLMAVMVGVLLYRKKR